MRQGWFQTLRLRHAAKTYARRLPRFLAEGWGGSETYTPGQIEVAARELKLDPAYIAIGYARFLPENEFDALRDRMAVQVAYAEARDLFVRFTPIVSAWSPGTGPAIDGP